MTEVTKTNREFMNHTDYQDTPAWGHDLTRDPENNMFVYEEAHYSTVLEAFYLGLLGFCGCGHPDLEVKLMRDVLSALAKRNYDNGKDLDNKASMELWLENSSAIKTLFSNNDLFEHHYFQWLDSLGMLEHGSTVFGSWLDAGGWAVLKMLIEHEDVKI